MIYAAILLPFLAAIILGITGTALGGAIANAAVSLAVLLLSLAAFAAPGLGLVHADGLGLVFGTLSAFIASTTALANIGYVRAAPSRFTPRFWRFYHALYQLVLGAALLGLYADNTGLLWAAMEAAILAAGLAFCLPRTAAALEAGGKYLILSGVGIVFALFGTMLLYLAAQPALGPGLAAMSFTALAGHAAAMDGPLLTLAFVFLLLGYGAMAALVPLHGWLPPAYSKAYSKAYSGAYTGAYSGGPPPLTTGLAGLTLNLALIAILRFRHLVQANAVAGGALPPGPFLLALGLASLLLAGVSLSRRQNARRFAGFSTIAHSGIAVFAFGIGGAAAIFGGLLHMLLRTLIESALCIALFRAAGLNGHFSFAHLRGMVPSNKYAAWLLGGAIFALTGLPPSGLFASEFIIISQTVQRDPWVSVPLALGLLLYAAALLRKLGPLIPHPAPAPARPAKTAPETHLAALLLALAVLLAFAMPMPLLHLLTTAAAALQ